MILAQTSKEDVDNDDFILQFTTVGWLYTMLWNNDLGIGNFQTTDHTFRLNQEGYGSITNFRFPFVILFVYVIAAVVEVLYVSIIMFVDVRLSCVGCRCLCRAPTTQTSASTLLR